MERVVQFGIDILINNDIDAVLLEKLIYDILLKNDIDILGIMFSDDVTKHYQGYIGG